MDDILYKKNGGVLKPTTPKVESEKVYGPSQEYLDFINAPKEKFDNVIEVDFKSRKRSGNEQA